MILLICIIISISINVIIIVVVVAIIRTTFGFLVLLLFLLTGSMRLNEVPLRFSNNRAESLCPFFETPNPKSEIPEALKFRVEGLESKLLSP